MTHSFSPRPAGGSARGWSYYSALSNCELQWFLKYLYRSKEAPPKSTGMEARFTPRHLLVGSLFHIGAETWYRSSWDGSQDTGAYNLDPAIDAIHTLATEREAEWSSPNERLDDIALASSLMTHYGQRFGPNGPEQDYPNYRVFNFNGLPAVELELGIDLEMATEGEVFTSKLDVILMDNNGVLWGMEHKTSAARRVHSQLQKFNMDGQVTGQYTNLLSHFPSHQIGGVIINIVVKDAAKTKPSFHRRIYTRTEPQIQQFLDSVRIKSARINQIKDGLTKTPDQWDTALTILDCTPNAERCYGMGKCDFFEICLDREVGRRILDTSFIPRVRVDGPTAV